MALDRQKFGRAVQARFLFDAQEKGLEVLIPFESLPGYDCVVDTGKKLLRVQVKGVHLAQKREYYSVNFRRRAKARPKVFDICAVWMADVQRWAFMPAHVGTKRIVRLTSDGKYSRTGWEVFFK
ncbi:MAG: group I intron-associated PD-(D/E)XK endonuclease [Chthoniobacteraceae bacterium]|nr:group I intron-associated PD-(D/E)XK endonuclease [Chthoniobacteraceae bacterium]